MHPTQLLLSKFLSGEISRLDPVYDPKYGYRYPVVEALVGDPEETEKFLNKLYETGILERELYDRIIYCPFCGSQTFQHVIAVHIVVHLMLRKVR